MKCSACKIIAHANCISVLIDKGSQLACKPTFRDVGVRQYREQTRTHHHWIHRRTEKGKCKQCGKVRYFVLRYMFDVCIQILWLKALFICLSGVNIIIKNIFDSSGRRRLLWNEIRTGNFKISPRETLITSFLCCVCQNLIEIRFKIQN